MTMGVSPDFVAIIKVLQVLNHVHRFGMSWRESRQSPIRIKRKRNCLLRPGSRGCPRSISVPSCVQWLGQIGGCRLGGSKPVWLAIRAIHPCKLAYGAASNQTRWLSAQTRALARRP